VNILFFYFLFLLSAPGDSIQVKDAWIRPADTGMNSALYFKMVNESDKADTLYKVTLEDAGMVMIHESYKKGDMMAMRMVNDIVIKPHSTFELKPGGFHIMLMMLKKDLKKDDEKEFELYFKSGKKIKEKAVIKDKFN
jgi:periplasmic copper chaperone A